MSVVILEGQRMRVTAETKAKTRQRILEAARQLFATNGYEASTTRDIADAAGIANGTLFNYFATKEAILASLAAEAVAAVHLDFEDSPPSEQSLEEDLFALVAAGLRKLKPLRKHLPALLETELNPLVAAPADGARALRFGHLEAVSRLAKKHGQGDLSPMALQLYWTLYTGVLMYWTQDRSPKQENTLALLDESLAMFAGCLQREDNSKMKGGAEPCPRP
jgi:AcrR family transcriptional regulator